MKKFFALFAAMLFVGSMMAEVELKATLDFTDNSAWNIPSDAKAIESASFSNGMYQITLQGTEGNGYRWYSSGNYLLIGKEGATLTFPAFTWNTAKIVITGRADASAATIQNIFVGETAVSTQTTGAKGENTYMIDAAYQAAGNVYVLKVLSNHNTQITKIEIYGSDEAIDPQPATPSYYIVGDHTEWMVETDYKMAKNPANEAEYMFRMLFPGGAAFKVVGVAGNDTTWYPGGLDNNYVIPGQDDIKLYSIYFRPDGQGGDGWHYGYIFVEEYVAPDINSCASAAEAVAAGAFDPDSTYVIEGYVTAIETAFNPQYNNVSFWMADSIGGGKVLEAFRAACESAEAAPIVGDKVRVSGKLKLYNTTPEFDAGCTYEIIEHGEPIIVVLDTINIARAVEIGMALADNASSDDEYVVAGWVVQAYAPNEGYTDQTWFMADEKGAFGEFEAYRCTPDFLVEIDQFVYVKGRIKKYVKNGNAQIEISNGTATHMWGQGISNTAVETNTVKTFMNGQLIIEKNGVRYNAVGQIVK